MMLNTIDQAIEDLIAGKMIIVVDDENRENEGDFVMPAQKMSSEAVNFMITHGKGLLCAPITQEVADKLDLPPMVMRSEDSMQTAFTISIDATEGVSTGISASDRSRTFQQLVKDDACPCDFVRPGHIFPLIAKDGGVLTRPGHTEAAVDLARLSGHAPVGAICEILTEQG